MKEDISKRVVFYKESNKLDLILKVYLIVIILLIVISYIGILPENIQHLVTEDIPGVSGRILTIDQNYHNVVIEINNLQLTFSAILSVLAAIFIIWRRNLSEVFAILFLGMIPREHKFWGIVRNKSNLKTLPFIQIKLFKINPLVDMPEFISQSVSDLDGRYRIDIDNFEKDLALKINTNGFKVFNKKVNQINTQITNKLIVEDIFLEPVNQNERDFLYKFNDLRPLINKIIIWVIFLNYLVYFPFSIWILLNNPVLINWLFALVMFITNIWNIMVIRNRYFSKPGIIMDKFNRPLTNQIFDLYDESKRITSSTTNNKGIINFDIEPGTYLIKPISEAKGEFIPIRINNKGYIDTNVVIYDFSKEGSGSLLNPFS